MKKLPLFLLLCAALSLRGQVEIDQEIVLTGSDGTRTIRQVEIPVNGTDAVNKDYVDNAVAAGGSSLPVMMSDESATSMSLGAAMRYCRSLEEGGYSDWYLPSIYEVLYVYSRSESAIPNENSANYVWAFQVQGANLFDYVHVLRLSDGATTVVPTPGSQRVRCVR
jgi:hypothetical protein